MHAHQRGCATSRLGCVPNVQSFQLLYSETTATKKVTLQASASKPVLVRISLVAVTALSGGTPAVSIGTSTTATEWLSAVTTLPSTNQGATQAVLRRITSDTDVYVKVSGSATAGELYVVLETMELNTQEA